MPYSVRKPLRTYKVNISAASCRLVPRCDSVAGECFGFSPNMVHTNVVVAKQLAIALMAAAATHCTNMAAFRRESALRITVSSISETGVVFVSLRL